MNKLQRRTKELSSLLAKFTKDLDAGKISQRQQEGLLRNTGSLLDYLRDLYSLNRPATPTQPTTSGRLASRKSTLTSGAKGQTTPRPISASVLESSHRMWVDTDW